MTARQAFHATLGFLGAVIFAAVVVVGYQIIIALLISILIASALRPLVLRVHALRVPLGLSILAVYLAIAIAVSVLLAGLFPPMANQFASYLESEARLTYRLLEAKLYVEETLTSLTGAPVVIEVDEEILREEVGELVASIRHTGPDLIDDMLRLAGAFILVIVMGFYWLTSRDQAIGFFTSLLPHARREHVRAMIEEIELTFGAYLRGIATVSTVVGTLGFIGLTVLGVPNAAVIALVYATVTAIPIIGGLIGVVLGVGIALLSSPTHALTTGLVTFALEQFESYFLSPRIMSQEVDTNPILIIVFVSAGFSLYGLVGGFLAVPIVGTLGIILKHLVFEPRKAQVAPDRADGGIILGAAPADTSV